MAPNKHAAIAYFIYGVIYFVGGLLALDQARMDTRGGSVPLWVYYALGGGLVVLLPALLWFAWGKVMRWIALILAPTVTLKGLYLLTNPTPYRIVWCIAAVVAGAMLFRAFWTSRGGTQRSAPPAIQS